MPYVSDLCRSENLVSYLTPDFNLNKLHIVLCPCILNQVLVLVHCIASKSKALLPISMLMQCVEKVILRCACVAHMKWVQSSNKSAPVTSLSPFQLQRGDSTNV